MSERAGRGADWTEERAERGTSEHATREDRANSAPSGADGIEDMLAKALTLGGTGLGLARTLLSSMNGRPAANGTANGAAQAPAQAVEAVEAVVEAKTDQSDA